MKRPLVIALSLLATVSCSPSSDVVKREALRRAELYESQGKLDEAIIEWRQALAVDPTLVVARHALGRAYAAKLWYRDAAAELLAAQEISPQPSTISADLGRVLIELGAWQRAYAQAERIQQSEPSNLDALSIRTAVLLGEGNAEALLASPAASPAQRGAALIALGRLSESEHVYRELLAERPADAQALAGLGELNLRRRRFGEAAAYFERADALRPGDPRIRVRLAAARVRLGRLHDAIKTLEEIHPRARSGGSLIALGWCYLRAQRSREAAALLAPLVEQAPRWVELRLLLGTSYLASGNPVAAVSELEQADQQAPGDPLIRVRLAAAYTRVGRPQDALHALDTLGAAAQQWPDYQLERSRALLRVGRLDEAYTAAGIAQRLIPHAPQPYVLLGQIEAKQGKPGRANAALAKALQLDQGYGPAHLALGRLRAAEGNMDEAIEAFDAAVRVDPTSGVTIRAKTDGLIAQKRVKEARRFVEAAVKADDRNPDLHALLGSVYMAQREPGRAHAAFRRALDLDPRSALPRLGLAELAVRDGHPIEAIGHLRAVVKDRPTEPTAVFWLAWLYRTEGAYDRAIGVLEPALNADPGQHSFSLALGELYLTTGRYGDAIVRMSDVLSREPDQAAAHLTRGQAYKATGQSEAAIRDFAAAIRSAPRSAAPHYHLARTYAVRGRVAEAQAAYRRAIEFDPGLETAKIELAVLARQPLDGAVWQRRIEQLQAAMRAEPRSVETREALARTLLAQGNVTAAQRELQQILERTLGHAGANYLMARVLSSQGKPEEAAEHLKTALRTNPSDVAAHMLLASHLLTRGLREQAAVHLEAVLKVDSARGDAKLELARLYAQDGRLGQAFDLARQLRRDEPANPGGPLAMGLVLLAQERPRDAVDAFATAITMKPDLVDAYRGLGQARQAIGQTDRAAASYERALALDGNDVGSLTRLAAIVSKAPNGVDRGLALATRAAELRPTAPDVLDTLGWIHYRRGAYAEAERVLVRAIERAPDHGLIQYHLGMVYVRLERPREAISALRHAARLDAGLARSERLDEVISGLGG
jgi:tetratricopeptide (TPR) repeat protein